MNSTDAQYLQEMKELLLEIKYWSMTHKEEHAFLLKYKAINKDGDVNAEYPKLFYKDKRSGDTKTFDSGGVRAILKLKSEELEKKDMITWIGSVPRFFSFYRMAAGILDKEHEQSKLIKS